MKSKYLLLVVLLLSTGTGTFAQEASRLIGLTKTGYSGTAFTVQDTSFYMYSGLHDTSNLGGLAYDSSYTLAYAAGLTTNNYSYRYYQKIDANNNLDTLLSQYYDTTAASWINYQLNSAAYDASNNVLNKTLKVWSIAGSAFVDTTQTMFTYSGTNLTVRIQQLYNTVSAQWVNNTKDSFSYDGNSNMVYRLTQRWDTFTGTWVNANQYGNTYNAGNLITQDIEQNWDTTTLAWNNFVKLTYDYNANNLLSNTITQRWKPAISDWINFKADTSTYSIVNDKITEITKTWDTTNSVWKNQTFNGNFYDANHNMLSDTTKNWNNPASMFVNNKLKIYAYNTYNQVTIYTTESWSTTAHIWQYNGGAAGDVQYRYYYELNDTAGTTGVNNVAVANGNKMTVYPVPASSVLNIQISWAQPQAFTVGIYDAQGILVRQWSEAATTSYSKAIPVNDLAAGNYMIKATGIGIGIGAQRSVQIVTIVH